MQTVLFEPIIIGVLTGLSIYANLTRNPKFCRPSYARWLHYPSAFCRNLVVCSNGSTTSVARTEKEKVNIRGRLPQRKSYLPSSFLNRQQTANRGQILKVLNDNIHIILFNANGFQVFKPPRPVAPNTNECAFIDNQIQPLRRRFDINFRQQCHRVVMPSTMIIAAFASPLRRTMPFQIAFSIAMAETNTSAPPTGVGNTGVAVGISTPRRYGRRVR